jgi:F-type H+-transporting ATPase subunit epsilon
MAAEHALRLVIVTPEKTVFDEPVSALRFPLYDGDIGVLPGRLPLIGRLGTGELKIDRGGDRLSYFIDGGFAQIRKSVVTLLTNQAVPTDQLTADQAERELEAARAKTALTDEDYAAKLRALKRARRMLALARR